MLAQALLMDIDAYYNVAISQLRALQTAARMFPFPAQSCRMLQCIIEISQQIATHDDPDSAR